MKPQLISHEAWPRCLVLFALLSATPTRGLTLEDRAADHEALRNLRDVTEQAINQNRMEELGPYLADDFSVVTYTDRQFSDFETFVARWKQTRANLLAGGSYTVSLLPDESAFYGNIALTKGAAENTLVTGGGSSFKFSSNWTAVCQKHGGAWKIVRAHSSIDPFGNPMIQRGIRKAAIKVGIGAGCIGLVLGWIGHVLFARRGRG